MIPFPRLHIAESTLNRILNAFDDTQSMFPMLQPAPIPPPDPIALGQEIDAKTTAPAPPVAPVEDEAAAGAAQESIFGGSPFAGAVDALM